MTNGPKAPRLRVSIVLHTFDRGGSGRVASYLARGFADLGLTVDVIVIARGGAVQAAVSELIGPDVPITYLGRESGARSIDYARALPRLIRALRLARPDVVIAAANNAALPTALAFRLAGLGGARLFLKTTNPIATSRHRGLLRAARLAAYRLVFRWTSGVLTLSGAESAEMAAEFPHHARLFRDVRNPYVTPKMLTPPATGRTDGARGRRIVTVARLTRQKRLERLIAAFARLPDRDASLTILGDGEEREALATMVASLGLADRVAMPGHVADVAPALHAADLFVLTSDYEGLPAAVLEAMAANCPVLSTDCFPPARALLERADGCAIIEDTRPGPLAALIGRHLDRPRPTSLRPVAELYSIENAVLSHAHAIGACPQRGAAA